MRAPSRHGQRGAALVEFALVSLFFFTLLIGIIEMGRVFFYFNSAAEATRRGARLYAVCGDSAKTFIRGEMAALVLVPEFNKDTMIYFAPPDAAGNVTVSITGASFNTVIPFVPITWTVPSFPTTLPTELFKTSIDGENNPVCS